MATHIPKESWQTSLILCSAKTLDRLGRLGPHQIRLLEQVMIVSFFYFVKSKFELILIHFFILDKAAVRSDAAAELDRLTRGAQKKPNSSSGNNSLDNNINSASEC